MSASQYRLYFLLQRTAHALKKEADASLAEAGGVTTAQAAVIGILVNEGPVSQKFLADRLMQRESAITTMADRLIKAGYVLRERSPTDGRAWILQATPAGREALHAIRAPFQAINTRLDTAFEDVDTEKLASGLRKLLEDLGGANGKAG